MHENVCHSYTISFFTTPIHNFHSYLTGFILCFSSNFCIHEVTEIDIIVINTICIFYLWCLHAYLNIVQ